ncbi:DUF6894 family protein [Bosea sp. MMO-172]|uniref:DUF6894 family protein n=1 Tax=Bosea sp. MMO-172 TaxID=3127885 RepID=UPI003019AE39
MARYYFDSMVSGALVEDEEGKELAEFALVRHYALDGLADIARHTIPQGAPYVAIHVRSEAGEIVYSVAVSVTEETARP